MEKVDLYKIAIELGRKVDYFNGIPYIPLDNGKILIQVVLNGNLYIIDTLKNIKPVVWDGLKIRYIQKDRLCIEE